MPRLHLQHHKTRLSSHRTAPVVLAAGLASLFVAMHPAIPEEAKPVRAAMTVYSHIVDTEAKIYICSRLDTANAESYDKVGTKYHNETKRIVVSIGLLVGREAKRADVDQGLLLESIDRFITSVVEADERTAEGTRANFVRMCHTLPKALAVRVTPFEPLEKKFPQEMAVIQASE